MNFKNSSVRLPLVGEKIRFRTGLGSDLGILNWHGEKSDWPWSPYFEVLEVIDCENECSFRVKLFPPFSEKNNKGLNYKVNSARGENLTNNFNSSSYWEIQKSKCKVCKEINEFS